MMRRKPKIQIIFHKFWYFKFYSFFSQLKGNARNYEQKISSTRLLDSWNASDSFVNVVWMCKEKSSLENFHSKIIFHSCICALNFPSLSYFFIVNLFFITFYTHRPRGWILSQTSLIYFSLNKFFTYFQRIKIKYQKWNIKFFHLKFSGHVKKLNQF